MNASANKPRRGGFHYFCEVRQSYVGGFRAWLFFVPYLLGAAALEPVAGKLPWPGLSPSLVLLGYLIFFPVIWRAVLLATRVWQKRGNEVASTRPARTVPPARRPVAEPS